MFSPQVVEQEWICVGACPRSEVVVMVLIISTGDICSSSCFMCHCWLQSLCRFEE